MLIWICAFFSVTLNLAQFQGEEGVGRWFIGKDVNWFRTLQQITHYKLSKYVFPLFWNLPRLFKFWFQLWLSSFFRRNISSTIDNGFAKRIFPDLEYWGANCKLFYNLLRIVIGWKYTFIEMDLLTSVGIILVLNY